MITDLGEVKWMLPTPARILIKSGLLTFLFRFFFL